jgi:hypothetical protein
MSLAAERYELGAIATSCHELTRNPFLAEPRVS